VACGQHSLVVCRQREITRVTERLPHTILLVEDEVLVRMLLADELRSAGHKVIEAANADEAFDVLAHTPDVKLVVTDIRMPGSLNGVTLATLIRSKHPLVKVLVMSGNPDLLRGTDHDGFLPKPFAPAALIALVAKVFRGNIEQR
jgi:two-component system, response regulator PdtaR